MYAVNHTHERSRLQPFCAFDAGARTLTPFFTLAALLLQNHPPLPYALRTTKVHDKQEQRSKKVIRRNIFLNITEMLTSQKRGLDK